MADLRARAERLAALHAGGALPEDLGFRPPEPASPGDATAT